MAGKSGGLISRLIMGTEKSEDYARSTLPSNRWELFWDIFKGRFWKLVLINVLVLLSFVPLFALLLFRMNGIANLGAGMPFNQGFGLGYQVPQSLAGIQEGVVARVNFSIYMFLPLTLLIAAVGVSGGAYVIRNMVWTEGIFVANDFWRGVRQNYKQIALIAILYSVFFYFARLGISLADVQIAYGGDNAWLFIVTKVISILSLLFYTVMTLHMITMSVTYDLKLRSLIKNSFLFTLGMLPQNVFFLILGLIPFLLILVGGGLISAVGVIIAVFVGFSLFLLVWTDFCQWAYDKFVNDSVPGAKKNKGIYEKVKKTDSEAIKQYRRQMELTRTSLNTRPIKPITDDDLKVAELPTSFNRNDLVRLAESKQAIYDDHARYVEEHKNDPEFQAFKEESADNADKEREKRIEKAKKELMKRKRK